MLRKRVIADTDTDTDTQSVTLQQPVRQNHGGSDQDGESSVRESLSAFRTQDSEIEVTSSVPRPASSSSSKSHSRLVSNQGQQQQHASRFLDMTAAVRFRSAPARGSAAQARRRSRVLGNDDDDDDSESDDDSNGGGGVSVDDDDGDDDGSVGSLADFICSDDNGDGDDNDDDAESVTVANTQSTASPSGPGHGRRSDSRNQGGHGRVRVRSARDAVSLYHALQRQLSQEEHALMVSGRGSGARGRALAAAYRAAAEERAHGGREIVADDDYCSDDGDAHSILEGEDDDDEEQHQYQFGPNYNSWK